MAPNVLLLLFKPYVMLISPAWHMDINGVHYYKNVYELRRVSIHAVRYHATCNTLHDANTTQKDLALTSAHPASALWTKFNYCHYSSPALVNGIHGLRCLQPLYNMCLE